MARPMPGKRSRLAADYDGPAAAIARRRLMREARDDAVERIHNWYENRPEENRRGPRKKRHTIYTRRLRRLAALRGIRNRRRRLHREQVLLYLQQEQAEANSPDEDPFAPNAQTPPQARSPAVVDDDEQQHASSHSSHHSADHSVHHSEQSEASSVSHVSRPQQADDKDDALTTDGKDTVGNTSETTAGGSDEESHHSADEPNDADQDASSDSQPARCIPRQELDELTKIAQSPSKPGTSSGVELVVRSSAPPTATSELQSPTPSTSTQGIGHRTRTKTESSSDRSKAKGGKSSKDNDNDNDNDMQRREPTQCDQLEASTLPVSSSEQTPQPTTIKVEQKSELLSESANQPTAPEESPKYRSPDSPKDRHSAKKHREKSEPGPSVQQPETSTAHSRKKSVRSSTSKSSNSAAGGSERNQKTGTVDDQSTDSSQKATIDRNPGKDNSKQRVEPTQYDRSEASTQLESTSEQTPQPIEMKHQPERLTKSAKTNPQPAVPKEAPKSRSPDSPKDLHSAKKHQKKSEPGPSVQQPETSTAHSPKKSVRSSTKNDGQNSQKTDDTADDRWTDDSKQTATTDRNTNTAEQPKAAESSQATEDHEDRQNRPESPDSGGSKEMMMNSAAEASSSQTSKRLKRSLRRDAEASSSAADSRSASKATKGSSEDRSSENSNKTEPETEATKQTADGKEKATKGGQTKQRGGLEQLVLQQARALKNCKKGCPDDAQCQPPE